jgi:predicted DNA-binding transcriptional regulator AlpA
MKDAKKPGTLATRATIRAQLKLTKYGTYKATQRDDFPAPIDEPGGVPVWKQSDVDKYLAKRKNGKRADAKA